MNPHLRLRTYPDTINCRLWLIECNAGARQDILHGTITRDKAELVAAALGVALVVEESPFGFGDSTM